MEVFKMARVFSTVQTVLAGANYDVLPPLGQDWEVTDFGSSAFVGVAPLGVPNLTAGMYNATVGVSALFKNSSAANPHLRGWQHPCSLFINNSNYLRVTNPEAGPLNIAISVRLSKQYAPNIVESGVISGTQTLIATGTATVRPPVGEDWLIREVGSSRWVGAQPAGLPNVAISLSDGTNAALIGDGVNTVPWMEPLNLHINNAVFMTLNNPVGAGATVGWSGVKSRVYGPNGFSQVISSVTVLGAGGVATIRPPAGYEYEINNIGCSVWVGAAPNQLPSISVAMTNGVIAPVLQQGTDTKGWLGSMRYFLNRTNWMTLTDAGAGSNVAVSGKIWKD
jgi:hypothetical protein